MKKYSVRIAVLIILIIVFATIYSVVNAAFGNDEVQFGYWVNLNPADKYKNFVILGTDEDEVRTDLILFCQYSEIDKTLNVLQIPRDAKINTSRKDKKINSVYGAEGVSSVKNAVEALTGIYPDNYVVLNFKGFRELIDCLGGVNYNVPIRMYYTDPEQNLTIDLKPGNQLLNGKQAEMFMRFRKNNDGSGYAEGDIGRLKAQRDFYGAVLDEVLGFNGLFNIGGIMETVGDNLKTDFTLSDLLENVDELYSINREAVNVMMLPGEGRYINDVSYYIVDNNKTQEVIQRYFKITK